VTDTPKLKERGGPGRGQGRKPGSFRTENRRALSGRFIEFKLKFAREFVSNPVEAAENAMYDEDHPEGEREPGDRDRYRETLKRLRLRGRSEDMFLCELNNELATEQDPERRKQLIKQLDDLGLSWQRRRHHQR
jgi:hypothetical protein